MSKVKGLKAESKTLHYLVSNEMTVLEPYGDNAPYDLAFEHNNDFIKVQCKTGIFDGDTVKSHIQRTNMTSNGTKQTHYNSEEVDVFAIYSYQREELYWIPFSEAPKTAITIRITLPKNNQSKGITLAKDCTLDNALEVINSAWLG